MAINNNGQLYIADIKELGKLPELEYKKLNKFNVQKKETDMTKRNMEKCQLKIAWTLSILWS